MDRYGYGGRKHEYYRTVPDPQYYEYELRELERYHGTCHSEEFYTRHDELRSKLEWAMRQHPHDPYRTQQVDNAWIEPPRIPCSPKKKSTKEGYAKLKQDVANWLQGVDIGLKDTGTSKSRYPGISGGPIF